MDRDHRAEEVEEIEGPAVRRDHHAGGAEYVAPVLIIFPGVFVPTVDGHPAVPAATLGGMRDLPALLDRLEEVAGPSGAVPSTDGWELVLAENVAYLVDDQRRRRALAELRRVVGLSPERILAAPQEVLLPIVAGPRPPERVQRLRLCAELAIAGAPWRAYPGIGAPGTDRIDLFTGSRAVLALDANALRVLTRLGYGDAARSYSAGYRQAQARASARLPATVPELQRAYQLLRRHGQEVCRRKDPACAGCPIAGDCPSAGHPPPLY